MNHAETFRPIPPGQVKLLPSMLQHRSDLNRRYLMSLRGDNLLQNHYMEAGLWAPRAKPEDCHWGWESPTCQLRGHFLGHWLSAAALAWVLSLIIMGLTVLVFRGLAAGCTTRKPVKEVSRGND